MALPPCCESEHAHRTLPQSSRLHMRPRRAKCGDSTPKNTPRSERGSDCSWASERSCCFCVWAIKKKKNFIFPLQVSSEALSIRWQKRKQMEPKWQIWQVDWSSGERERRNGWVWHVLYTCWTNTTLVCYLVFLLASWCSVCALELECLLFLS